MRAVRFDEYGDYDVLKVVDVAEPEAGPDEVLVRLAASAVNPFDNTCRRGWVAAVQPGMIQGNEGAGVVGFNIYFQPPEAFGDAWATVLPLLADGRVKPVVARTFPLEDAAEATRYLIEDRPFGKVVLTI